LPEQTRFKVYGNASPSKHYERNGRILALTRYQEDNTVIDQLSYAYIAGTNKLQSVTDAVGVTSEDWDAESSTFAYDGNGNVVEMLENGVPAISAITYDHRNLPVSLINRNGDVVTYRYNASGQRIYKQVGSQTPEYYLMDGDQTVAVYQNGAVRYWNIMANGVVGRREAAGNKFYYLKDHLGSTRAVVNASGTVVEAHDYYPFGLLMPGRDYQSGSETKEKFTGKERDRETGLDYFGARYYSPALGRWLAVDPLASKYPDWSPYVYSFNNPVNYFDPNGLAGLTAKKRQFYKTVAKNIITAASEKGILETKAYLIVAQRIQENGWGTTAPGNNLFNIKGEYKGASITITTHEEDSKGNRTKIVDKFRKYDSQSESIKDYLEVLENNFPDAYKALTDDKKTVDDFVKGLENGTKGKYATDADYGDQIKKLYKQVKKEYEQYKKEQEKKDKKDSEKEKKSQQSSGD